MAEAINAGLYLTPRLTREQMREAIEEPAGVMGCEIEPALVTTLLEDVGHDPDQLPLLQHALQRLWIESEHGKLTLNAYRQYGSLGDALSGRLDNILKSLSLPHQQRIAEILFRNLSRRDAEQRDTRQPVRLSRIRDLADADEKNRPAGGRGIRKRRQ
ncbi:MAG: hypothetical protein HC887_05135 [Desulfobacteraceae bacterium]|nr:hypothetical protein [Desulfobacteraceae bacterium]